MSTQEENSQHSQGTDHTMSLSEEWEQEDEQEITEITEKEELPEKEEISKESQDVQTSEDYENTQMDIIYENEDTRMDIVNDDNDLYYSRENPGYTTVILPGLYPFQVSKPTRGSGLRRMTTTWSIDENFVFNKSMLKFQEKDSVHSFNIQNNNEENHCLSILQTVFNSTNVKP
jgi:hypothetical protein